LRRTRCQARTRKARLIPA